MGALRIPSGQQGCQTPSAGLPDSHFPPFFCHFSYFPTYLDRIWYIQGLFWIRWVSWEFWQSRQISRITRSHQQGCQICVFSRFLAIFHVFLQIQSGFGIHNVYFGLNRFHMYSKDPMRPAVLPDPINRVARSQFCLCFSLLFAIFLQIWSGFGIHKVYFGVNGFHRSSNDPMRPTELPDPINRVARYFCCCDFENFFSFFQIWIQYLLYFT